MFDPENNAAQRKKLIKATLIGLAVIVLLIFASGSWYTVDQGERGVHLRNGKIIGTAEPGLGFKLPLIDTIARISTQTHTISYEGVQAYSSDQQPATMRASVTFSVPVDRVEEVYSDFKNIDVMQARLIDRQVPTQVENIFGKYTAASVVKNRIKFGTDVTQAISVSIIGPVTVHSVQVENIDFSNAYEKSVEDRMRAEVEVQTQQQNLEKEKISAEIAVTKAQAEADSAVARAKAEAESMRLRAIAEAESIRLKGDAEASAIKSRADALASNQNLIELTKAEKWDGRLPTTVLPNSAVPYFNTNK